MSSTPTQALLAAAAAGDRGALDELVVRNLPDLRAFVRLRAGPQVLVREGESDIVQSVCRDLLENAERFRFGGEEGFRRWLFSAAMRKILKKHRFHTAQKRDVREEAAAAQELLEAYSRIATPSRELGAIEEVDRIERAFAALPDDWREAVLLSRVVGLSRAEVAKQMGRTEDSVKNLLHRALARLTTLLGSGSE